MKSLIVLLTLLIITGCTTTHNVQFRIDERYYNAIPQYQFGKSYIGSNFDTLTFTLHSTENRWPVAAYDPSEDRHYSIQQKTFHYSEKNNPDLTFYINLITIPDLEKNIPAGTELECVLPSKNVLRLAFLAADSLAEAPTQYIGNYMVQGQLYAHVYGNPSLFYYSADGELLKFKLNNDVWYEALPY